MTTTSRPQRLPMQAKVLFTLLRHDNAQATDEEWDALALHLESQLDVIAGGSEGRRDALTAEFNRIRAVTVEARDSVLLRIALAEGAAELVRDRGDGLEEWTVTVTDGPTGRLLLPVTSTGADAPDVDVARAAMLGGTCPSCGRQVELISGFLEVTHNSKCPARRVA